MMRFNKSPTIKLSWPHESPNELSGVQQLYRIEAITNNLDYNPGQYLTREQADYLCQSPQWQVTIVPVIRR